MSKQRRTNAELTKHIVELERAAKRAKTTADGQLMQARAVSKKRLDALETEREKNKALEARLKRSTKLRQRLLRALSTLHSALETVGELAVDGLEVDGENKRMPPYGAPVWMSRMRHTWPDGPWGG